MSIFNGERLLKETFRIEDAQGLVFRCVLFKYSKNFK